MDDIIRAATDIIQPVMEGGMILAGQYVKACNRSTITAMDVQYAMRYASRNYVGKHIGTLFPEDEDDSEEDTDDEIETVDEDDEPFTRYSGDDQLMNDINSANDTWNTWLPESPMERMLKDSIDRAY